jgi:hypothetical protein
VAANPSHRLLIKVVPINLRKIHRARRDAEFNSIISDASRNQATSTMPSNGLAKSSACAVKAEVVMKTPFFAFRPARAP